MAGHIAAFDRLVFVSDSGTILLDPRTGEWIASGWGRYDFFEAAGTVFIGGVGIDRIGAGCGFNTATLAWDHCYEGLSPRFEAFASRVEDPINSRVFLIHQYSVVHSGVADASSRNALDVWALDLKTGTMVELLPPSG